MEGVASRLWPATTDAACWAAVDLDGRRTADRFTVWEHGPHRLWSLVEAAYGWWREAGRPGPERFGLTVAPDGTHTPWLDTPDRPVPVLGPPAVSPGRGRSAGGGGAVGGRTAGGPRP